jgi:hypothetical protein
LTDTSWNDWEEAIVGPGKSWSCFIWNPGKRDRKAFYTSVKLIQKQVNKPKKKKAEQACQLLLDYIKNFIDDHTCISTQFKVTYRQDLALEPAENVLFTSDIIPIY